jgi:Concanavalin A-like lectin/glucanases superfamily
MFDVAGRCGTDLRQSRDRASNQGLLSKLTVTIALTTLAVATHSQPALASSVPIAAYSFDEGSGPTAKDSAGSNDGSISGATWTTGKYGSALEFDGIDDLVSIPDAADLDLTGSFTLEAWVRPDAFSAARPAISKVGLPEAGLGGYQLEGTSAGMPRGRVANSGAVKGVEGTQALSTEKTWSHLALTSNGSTLRLYVNGVLGKSGEGLSTANTSASLKIGNGLGSWFDGLIDEVRIYDEARSEGQIQADRDTAVGLDQLPIAAYSFDEGSGPTAKDSAGSNDGSISGATWTTGKYGSALEFDGIDDLVSIPDAADLDLTSTFTLEAWVRPDTATDWSPVIAKNENPGSGYGSGYVLFSQGPGKPRGWLANTGTTKSITGLSALPTNEWSQIAFTSDGTNLRLYIEGKLVGSPAPAIAAGTTATALELGH